MVPHTRIGLYTTHVRKSIAQSRNVLGPRTAMLLAALLHDYRSAEIIVFAAWLTILY